MLVEITFKDQKMELEVEASETVLQIKEKVEKERGIPPDNIRLIHCGTMLEDDKTAEEYGVKDGAVMFMLLNVTIPMPAKKPISWKRPEVAVHRDKTNQ